jgi:hypothetical protein
MKRSFAFFKIATFTTIFSNLSFAGSFPGQITGDDLKKINLKLAGNIAHNSWSMANSKPEKDPDLTIGLESSLGLNADVNSYGDSQGRIPSTVALPKIYLSIGFPQDIHISSSFLPGIAGISTYGFGGELFFLRNNSLSSSILLHYSHTKLFGDYLANTQGVQLTMDYALSNFSVYAAGGITSVESKIKSSLLKPGTEDKYYGGFQSHFILGTKIEGDLPFLIQIESVRLQPTLALIITKEF